MLSAIPFLCLAGFAVGQISSTTSSAAIAVSTTTCNGQTYVYNELAGYGFVPSDARDKFGDTLGGFGSAISFDRSSWRKVGKNYKGTFYAVPDRGWNTEGTLNYFGRVHQFSLTLSPQPGDGFGGNGTGGKRIAGDNEGLVRASDGTYWISDEYGPNIYHYANNGVLLAVITPPEAFVPMRNGSISFSADSPPYYNPDEVITPADPDSGRENNQGLEGLTISSDGTKLYALTQSALVQDGGTSSSKRRYARLLEYDITASPPTLSGEFVVPLPMYIRADGKSRVAAQSEIHFISPTQFFVLARDSSAGGGQANTTSVYRHIDIFDISNATNVAGNTYDCATCAVAPGGTLDASITPATYCSFLDYNINSQLNRFGLHNGGDQNPGLLNEKWESIAVLPIGNDEYYCFTVSDNDFITQNGFLNRGNFQYADGSGFNLDNQMLAFRITLPSGSTPS